MIAPVTDNETELRWPKQEIGTHAVETDRGGGSLKLQSQGRIVGGGVTPSGEGRGHVHNPG